MAPPVYHLTCPSCQDVTDSPFVRNGAVVRCGSCDNKYRIKSSHFTRETESGPRTLAETDSVLRSDSVDIDPDEAAPVSIDEDGNVVGLSGLSELMRWSDTDTSNQADAQLRKAKARAKRKEAEAARAQGALPDAALAPEVPGAGRARAQAMKRRNRVKLMVMLGGGGVLLTVIAILLVGLLPSGPETQTNPTDNPNTPDNASSSPSVPSGLSPGGVGSSSTTPGSTDQPDAFEDSLIFGGTRTQPLPNPQVNFQAPWDRPRPSTLPEDTPARLTAAQPLAHEGWYILNPPREPGAANRSDDGIEIAQITTQPLDNNHTLITASLSNTTRDVVMDGEIHVALFDSAGKVFAETYLPLAMIQGNTTQPIGLPIPNRHWSQSRRVQMAAQINRWAPDLDPLPGITLNTIGRGRAAATRISFQNQGDAAIRSLMIKLDANDDTGNTIASFLISRDNLNLWPTQWLDLVVSTPLPTDVAPADISWSATAVQP